MVRSNENISNKTTPKDCDFADFELPQSEILLYSSQIAGRVVELAQIIEQYYADSSHVTLLILLEGARVFADELTKHLSKEKFSTFYAKASSYKTALASSGKVDFCHDLNPLSGKTVLIVDDIYDSGLTLRHVLECVKPVAHSVNICVLLKKEEAHQYQLDVDFVGFAIADRYVFGYGLDYQQNHRSLPDIHALKK